MDTVFDATADRTRSRLTVLALRTPFGTKQRPRTNHTELLPRVAAVIETLQYGLTIFKVHFGALTLKGYTKGDHVLRLEAIAHNTKALGVGRVLDKFPEIVARLAGMVERFCTTLDCVDVAFIPDGILDKLPQPAVIGRTRVGCVDLNKVRIRTTLTAVNALAAAPDRITVPELAAKVNFISPVAEYSVRRGAYDLRKLRAHDLITKPGHGHRYRVTPHSARTIVALLVLRDQVVGPIVAGIRSPRWRKPAHWTAADRDYEALRIDRQIFFDDLAVTTAAA